MASCDIPDVELAVEPLDRKSVMVGVFGGSCVQETRPSRRDGKFEARIISSRSPDLYP